jgi:flagellar motor switch protein FliN/FliY
MKPTDTAAVDLALAVAREVARMLPSVVPLEVTTATGGSQPTDVDVAVVASFIGAVSADLVVIADRAIQEALTSGNGPDLPLADALRPALEAAADVLGTGVLDTARTMPAPQALTGDGMTVFPLASGGQVKAWVGVRLRAQPGAKSTAKSVQGASLRLLYDVDMTLTAELGRTKIPLREVLELVPGTVLELDRAAGSPADLMVNGRLIARGEIVVIDEEYGIRITEIVAEEASAG